MCWQEEKPVEIDLWLGNVEPTRGCPVAGATRGSACGANPAPPCRPQQVFRFLGRPPCTTVGFARRRVSEKAQGLNRGMAGWRYGDLGAAGGPKGRLRWTAKRLHTAVDDRIFAIRRACSGSEALWRRVIEAWYVGGAQADAIPAVCRLLETAVMDEVEVTSIMRCLPASPVSRAPSEALRLARRSR